MKPRAGTIPRLAVGLSVAIAVVVIPALASAAPPLAAEQPAAAPLLRKALALPNPSATPRRFTLLNSKPLWVDDAPHPPPHRNWPFAADPRRWPRLFANTTECTVSFDPVLRRHRWQP